VSQRLTAEEKAFRVVSEKQLQSRMLAMSRLYGWRVAHFHDSRRQVKPGMFVGDVAAKGFPDMALVHADFGFACLELKKELGRLTEDQRGWLDDLSSAGISAMVVRPSLEVLVCSWLSRGFPAAGIVSEYR